MSIALTRQLGAGRRALRWPLPRRLTLSLATLIALLALWWLVARLGWVDPLFLPPPERVLAQLLTIAGPPGFMDATLWQHLGASLGRILVALAAAAFFGITAGIAMGLSPTVRGMLDPLIELYRPVPPLAYLPLMVIWFGIGETLQGAAHLSGHLRPRGHGDPGGGAERQSGASAGGPGAGGIPDAGAVARDTAPAPCRTY